MEKRITINQIKKPREPNVNQELQWFCDSLGLFGNRDKDKSCFRMFVVLLKDNQSGLTSDQISEQVGLSRGTVVHHLHKLIDSGLVVTQRNRYMIRVNRLQNLVEEVERDILNTMDDLRKIATEIDDRLRF